MRNTFIKTLSECAKKDKRIFLVNGDLGYNVLEPFARAFPDRYINIGVAEQNMIGVSAGLALSGKVVYAYSIIPFATMRCFEQIRNDVCMQRANVRVVRRTRRKKGETITVIVRKWSKGKSVERMRPTRRKYAAM